jgi:hypothetical protein
MEYPLIVHIFPPRYRLALCSYYSLGKMLFIPKAVKSPYVKCLLEYEPGTNAVTTGTNTVTTRTTSTVTQGLTRLLQGLTWLLQGLLTQLLQGLLAQLLRD